MTGEKDSKRKKGKSRATGVKRGRPTLFTEVVQEKILTLAKTGATDMELAEAIGVTDRTINYWKARHADFFQALKQSKDLANQIVEASLFQRAIGYSHPSEKIFSTSNRFTGEIEIERVPIIEHYPPDTVAAIFWLKNRDPERWRERPEPTKDEDNSSITEIRYQTEWGGTGEPPTPGSDETEGEAT